ncbi:MAG: GNAT family N-acetyltransferase [Acidimicrobiales bacterium]|nr:MAG: GNAT family N-acetyltransferase [Acidimicrobiales bacterium]
MTMAVPEISFRALRVEDLEVLVGWFAEPDVARWWNQRATLDAVTEKYLPRIEGREPTRMWIVEVDGVPAGLIQDYLHADVPEYDECVGVPDAVGIDYLLGGAHRGRGVGFVRRGECDPPDEPPAYVYSISRTR